MKNKVDFRKMSKQRCIKCNRPLKQNLVDKKIIKINNMPTGKVPPLTCYKCHQKLTKQEI